MTESTAALAPDESLFSLDKHSVDLDAFYATNDDGVFYVGHASIIARLNGRTYLFDPVCQRPPYLASWFFYPPQVMDPRLLEVDAVFVSHCHQDHFDVEFLRKLPKSTPLYIIGGRPDFTRILVNAGLTPTEIQPGKKLPFEAGIEVYGLLHEYNKIDASIILKTENFSVYHGNDNFVTAKSLLPVREIMGAVDVGCIPYGFIHWYPFLLEGVDPQWREEEGRRMMRKYLELGLEEAEAIDAKVVIPFGTNLVYHDSADSTMNRAVLSPIDFSDYAKSKDPVKGDRVKPMFAGDYILKNRDGSLKVVFKTIARPDYKKSLQKFLESHRRHSILDSEKDVDLGLTKDLAWLRAKVKKVPVHDHQIAVASSGPTPVDILIDLKDLSVTLGKLVDESRPYSRFVVEPVALNCWLKQEISFEEILGTRRFRLWRKPNVYDRRVLDVLDNWI